MHRFADVAEDLNKKLQCEASSPSAFTGRGWERPLALQSVHAFINKPQGRLTWGDSSVLWRPVFIWIQIWTAPLRCWVKKVLQKSKITTQSNKETKADMNRRCHTRIRREQNIQYSEVISYQEQLGKSIPHIPLCWGDVLSLPRSWNVGTEMSLCPSPPASPGHVQAGSWGNGPLILPFPTPAFHTLSFSCLLSPSSPQLRRRPIKNCSWKARYYSFVRNTRLLPASTNYYLSGAPTVRCLTNHSSQPLTLLPASPLLLCLTLCTDEVQIAERGSQRLDGERRNTR